VLVGIAEIACIFLYLGYEPATRALRLVAVGWGGIWGGTGIARGAGYLVHSKYPGWILEGVGWGVLLLPFLSSGLWKQVGA